MFSVAFRNHKGWEIGGNIEGKFGKVDFLAVVNCSFLIIIRNFVPKLFS